MTVVYSRIEDPSHSARARRRIAPRNKPAARAYRADNSDNVARIETTCIVQLS